MSLDPTLPQQQNAPDKCGSPTISSLRMSKLVCRSREKGNFTTVSADKTFTVQSRSKTLLGDHNPKNKPKDVLFDYKPYPGNYQRTRWSYELS